MVFSEYNTLKDWQREWYLVFSERNTLPDRQMAILAVTLSLVLVQLVQI